MKNIYTALSLTSLLGLASCAGPETYDQKMSRYTPKTLMKNQVPEINIDGFSFSQKISERKPASVKPVSGEKSTQDQSFELNITNKKLYFVTLLGQYESLKKYGVQFDAPDVNICPHFHTSLLQYNEKKPTGFRAKTGSHNSKKFSYDKDKLNDETYVSTRPELSLPLSQDEVTPKVVDVMRSENEMTEFKMNELVHRALDIHLSKTYTEIRELCEYGVSDNYYIYENLITHIKNSDFKADRQNMNTLLKTTVFSNIALVTSMEKIQAMPMRSIASVKEKETSTYANELMTRLNVEWAKEYFDHLKMSK